MADNRSHGSGFRLDIQQLQLEAQNRWLRPAEICEILQNYRKFHIASEPPYKPLSGSLFLFDRKVLRFFRKDGHNWRKKKDGKTVKEAHEKLKVGSVDVLHCYYAHGEENENFQRRSYWLLEEDFMHIVFVHYLEVKGSKMSTSCIKDVKKLVPNFQNDNSLSPGFSANNQQATSANTDSPSPTSTLTSAYEEYESEDYHQASSKSSSLEVPLVEACVSSSHYSLPYSGNQSVSGGDYTPVSLEAGTRDSYGSSSVSRYKGTPGLASWEEALEYHPTHMQTLPAKPRIPNDDEGQLFIGDSANKEETGHHQLNQANLQVSSADQHWNKWHMDQILGVDLEYDFGSGTSEQKSYYLSGQNLAELFLMNSNEQDQQPMQCNIRKQDPDTKSNFMERTNLDNGMATSGTGNYSLIAKHALLEGSKKEDSLKKTDSFSRWIAKELGDVEELHTQSSNGITWSLVGTGDLGDDSIHSQLQLGTDSLNPSLSQDQLFSILDFTPNWAYSDRETEVLIRGIFLKSQQEVAKFTWSCMFGEVEVPTQIIAEGCLRCYAPLHKAEVVPFYLTCSNRLACSEVREFEYQVGSMQNIDALDVSGSSSTWIYLHIRLEKILSSIDNTNLYSEIIEDKQFVVKSLVSLMEEEEKYSTAGLISENDFSESQIKVLQKELKHKFYSWLIYKVTEFGKGPNVLDEEGQGVLHLAAALGYNWTLKPLLVSGVNIDFRDVNGWTALHWAAFCGREDTVVTLVSLGAIPGALTDPSPKFPSGRTPAELASGSGHKGISGFLAEYSLTLHLSSLKMNDSKDDGCPDVSGLNAVQSVLERTATPSTAGAIPDALSLRDSLAAVCNATQAVSRIHQIFRMQSFQRKQVHENDCAKLGPLDEHSISLLTFKTSRMRQNNGVHDAAICIQKKFRGWKRRKEFLVIRQRIVKIQAHVRGHQVRKKNPSIIWSVGILEKVILRWRRKGSGLRGFRSDAVLKGPKTQDMPSQEDDYDFLREGRNKAEERFQKALARVKSMAQYPEGRAQYRRLLTVAEGIRENKDTCDMTLSSPEVAADGDEDLTDLETLLDDDIFMSIAFE